MARKTLTGAASTISSTDLERDAIICSLSSEVIATNRRTLSTRNQYERTIKVIAKKIRELFPDEHTTVLNEDSLIKPLKVIARKIRELFPDEHTTVLNEDSLIKPLPVYILDKVLTSIHTKINNVGLLSLKTTSTYNSTISAIKYMHEISEDKRDHAENPEPIILSRCVVSLDQDSPDFSVLPPYFIDLTDVNFQEVVPVENWSKSNTSFKSAIPFMIASIIHHWDFWL